MDVYFNNLMPSRRKSWKDDDDVEKKIGIISNLSRTIKKLKRDRLRETEIENGDLKVS